MRKSSYQKWTQDEDKKLIERCLALNTTTPLKLQKYFPDRGIGSLRGE